MVNQQLIHEEYDVVKRFLNRLLNCLIRKNICDEEERAFYQLLRDFFLQQRQKDVIKGEKY